jgi:preprotein translocase subunit SecG
MFGGRGAGNFLTKLTTGAAAIYMATSLTLSYLGITGEGDRLFEDGVIEQQASPETSVFEELGTVPADETPIPADTAPAETPEQAPAP